MTKTDTVTTQTLKQMLTERTGGKRWQEILGLLAQTGVADNGQIKDALGLSHDPLRHLFDQIKLASKGYPPIFIDTNFTSKRAGRRGQPSAIYKLTEIGAALLRSAGEADARPCGLTGYHEIQHAVFILDIRLAAQKAGLAVKTDAWLSYAENSYIRPDNLVTLPDQTLAIFEVEQLAKAVWIQRITTSVANKANFFNSTAGETVSPAVRMLVNVSKPREIAQTQKIWRQAMRVVASDQNLPFRLLMLPLNDFLEAPDWEKEPDPQRWIEIKLETAASGQAAAFSPTAGKPVKPDHFFTRTAREDYLVLKALLREGQAARPGPATRPDPDFFKVMRLIYSASHAPERSALEQAAIPYESLDLLREYLFIHPGLVAALNHNINKGGGMRWMPTTIAYRLQTIINRFLEYHGFKSEGPLEVSAEMGDNFKHPSRKFDVLVRIKALRLLYNPEDEFPPTHADVIRSEAALTWVLRALFEYPHHMGINESGF